MALKRLAKGLYMKRISKYLAAVLALIISAGPFLLPECRAERPPRIEMRRGDLYIDGEKFLIRGVGYSPYRPGTGPGSPIPPDIVERDFRKISEAGFNTIRVWDTLPDQFIRLADKYGLKVIQAVALSPNTDFTYSGFQRQATAWTKAMCRKSKGHPNVIMYLLMNEPHAAAILNSGLDDTTALYRRLIEIVRSEDPSRPVSMANAAWTLWMDQSLWDIVCFNAYGYSPSLIDDIGYDNFLQELKRLHAADKGFLITEFGYSVSPEGEGGLGYGGNTPEEQACGLISNFKDIIMAGAIGGCVFEWNDEWWKAGNPDVHDGHAEEWFGLLGIGGKGRSSEKLRPAYYSLQKELEMVITSPRRYERLFHVIEVEVNALPGITDVNCGLEGLSPVPLTQSGPWWRGHLSIAGLKPGLHKLTVTGFRSNGSPVIREVSFISASSPTDIAASVRVKLSSDRNSYKNGDTVLVKARFLGADGDPLRAFPVSLGIDEPASGYLRRWKGVTDGNGMIERSAAVRGVSEEWFYIAWAGAEAAENGVKKRYGRIEYFPAYKGDGYPVQWAEAAKVNMPLRIDGAAEEIWSRAEGILVDPGRHFVDGAVTDRDDLSAEVRALWDESNLYLLAQVRDDHPLINTSKGGDVWNGDCIELFISIDPGAIPAKGYSPSDFQLVIGSNGEAWIYGQAAGGVRNKPPAMSEIAVLPAGAGYTIEARLDITNFRGGASGRFSAGDVLGFDVAIADKDDPGKAREGKVVWNGLQDGYVNSALWGRMRLKE